MTTKLKMILLIGLSLVPGQAFASLMQVTVTWSLQYGPLDGSEGERPPLDGSPNPFAGTAVFQYDPAPLTGSGLESIEDIMLLSLTPNPLTIGSTDFTVANARASIYFEDGAFDFLSVYGLPNDNNVSIDEGGPDFQVVVSSNDPPIDSIGLRTQAGDSTDFYRTVLRSDTASNEAFSLTYQAEPVHDNGVVPEPASVITWCVLSLGLVGIAIRRKK